MKEFSKSVASAGLAGMLFGARQMANVMTQPGETTGYSLSDHVAALMEHAPGLELSCVYVSGHRWR